MNRLRVSCPTCRAQVEWSEASQWRPFCSARCKGIDLGEWASNRYVVAGEGAVDAGAGSDGSAAAAPARQ